MQKFTFHRESTDLYTEQQNRMVYRQEELLSFLYLPYRLENFEKQAQLKARSFSSEQRSVLTEVLSDSYTGRPKTEAVEKELELLKKSTTFTVTTGHQLNIFTGPLYFIYKILHTIRLAEELNSTYEEYHFTPIYWMASEDHDFEEIRTVEIFGKQIAWESDQKGPVGKFDLDGLDELKREFASFFSGEALDQVSEILNTYTGQDLADATFNLINRLFGQYGLLIVNADNSKLKTLFAPVLLKEIETSFSHDAVNKTNVQLEKEGMKTQVHAREINLFYCEKGLRERILHLEDGYFVEGKGKFTKKEMAELIEKSPELFSPNVILRPVYQEMILPNLCYIGGVGEIAYWLQLKGIFDELNLPFPLLAVRNSLIWIDSVTSKKIARTELLLEELFFETDHLKRQYVFNNEEDDIDFSVIDSLFQDLKSAILEKVSQNDPGLEKYAQSEVVKIEKQIIAIREKLFRSLKSKHDQALVSIEQIKNKLFPSNGLQERSVNLFSLCAEGKVDERISQLHHFIDPFEPNLIMIRE